MSQNEAPHPVSLWTSAYSAVYHVTSKSLTSLGRTAKATSGTIYRNTAGQIPFLKDCARNVRYAFVPTPAEYARMEWDKLDLTDSVLIPIRTGTGVILEEYARSTPLEPGTIRVKLYNSFKTLYQDSPLSIDIPLGPSGELDLDIVQRKWNLQNCYAVDSRRLQIFETQTPGVLSGVAVKMLTDDQFWLRVIEKPSAGRVTIRNVRSSIQAMTLRSREIFASLNKRPSGQQLKGCLKTFSFLVACFIAKLCMDYFHMHVDVDREAACSLLWRTLSSHLTQLAPVD